MKRKLKIAGFVFLGLLVAFQFYQPARNMDSEQSGEADFIQVYQPPKDVQRILQNSCYNCHSNNTRYEWYNYIQPVRTVVEYHIKSAKGDLNFSDWAGYSDRKQKRLLQSIANQVEQDKMPLPSYLLLHPYAKLTKDEKQMLISWIENQE